MPSRDDIAVIFTAGPQPALARTVADAASVAGEVAVALAWRSTRRSLPPLPITVRAVIEPVQSPLAAVNRALAELAAPAVLVLAAGDRLPAALPPLADADAIALGSPEAAWWLGLRPAGVPRFAARALVRRAAVLEAGGFDDRLHDLGVATVDLLSRLTAVADRTDVLVARSPSLRAATRAGRSAQALDALCAADGRTVVRVGPRRAGVGYRAAAPLLALTPLRGRAGFALGRGAPPLQVTPLHRTGLPPRPAVQRPAVAVVVPFAGDAAEGRRVIAGLAALATRPGDELVVVDNAATDPPAEHAAVRVVRADAERSSYHARNAGWQATRAPWVLFMDADCTPPPGLLDALFAPPPDSRTGAVAGAVLDPAGARTLAERYSVAVEVLSQARNLQHPVKPFAVTANLLVRRAALEQLGGFCEGVRSGGDVELCWRLQELGWQLEWRPRAGVEHAHRHTLRALLRQYRRYGGGIGWLGRRHPGVARGWLGWQTADPRALARDLVAARPGFALARAIDATCVFAAALGQLSHNRPPRGPGAVLPDPRDPVADGVVRLVHRPLRLQEAPHGVPVRYAEDDAPLERLAERLLPARAGGRGG